MRRSPRAAATGALHGVPLGAQGHVRPQGQDRQLGRKNPRGQACDRERDRHRPLQGSRARIHAAALHLTEFAFGPTGHNYILGHARNPWDPTRITGGSSSGTACAVALGAIPAGLGSDTAGRCACPRRTAACPRSSRPGDASRALAPCRSRSASTCSASSRATSKIRRSCSASSPVPIRAIGPPRTCRCRTISPRWRKPVKGLKLGIDDGADRRSRSGHAEDGRARGRCAGQGRPRQDRLPLRRLADASTT